MAIEWWLLPIGLFALGYLYRADFSHYSIFTVGVFRRIRRYKAEETDHECSDHLCESDVEDGELRRAYKEIVVCGCPLVRFNKTSNIYCREHTSFEFAQGEYRETTTERLAQTLISAIVAVATVEAAVSDTDEPFDDVVSDVQSQTNAAFELAGVAFIVVIFAALFSLHKKLRS